MVFEQGKTPETSGSELSPSCCHHWVIQAAVGPMSQGSCQKCGEVKQFKNSIDYETEWTNRKELAPSPMVDTPPDALEEMDEAIG